MSEGLSCGRPTCWWKYWRISNSGSCSGLSARQLVGATNWPSSFLFRAEFRRPGPCVRLMSPLSIRSLLLLELFLDQQVRVTIRALGALRKTPPRLNESGSNMNNSGGADTARSWEIRARIDSKLILRR